MLRRDAAACVYHRMPHASHLVVRLGFTLVALPVAQVVETCRVPAVLDPALAGAAVRGVCTLRGEAVPVFDLGVLLGLAAATHGPESRLVTVRLHTDAPAQRAAFAVDGVLGVHALDELEAIALPGGEERRLGRFDTAFAHLIDASGVVSGLDAREPGDGDIWTVPA